MNVRVQLPAGAAFERALIEAASKYAMRQDISAAAETAFLAGVGLAAQAVNSTEPKAIELVLEIGDASVKATVCAIEPRAPMGAPQLDALADKATISPPAAVVISAARNGA